LHIVAVHEMTVASKSDHCGVLRQRQQAVLLERMFHGRPAGADGGAAFIRRLRWDRRRRAGELLDAPDGESGGGRSGDTSGRTGNMPMDTLESWHDAVMRACDARDGVHDGLLEDPTRCFVRRQAACVQRR
jgi:hypothetical protein